MVQGLKNELKAADRFLGGKDGRMVVAPKLREDGTAAWETQVVAEWTLRRLWYQPA